MADYDYWTKALADPKALHNREFRITTEPQCGFFRTRRVNEPVAIFEENGALNILVNGIDIDPSEYETVWLNCCKYPVTEKEYHRAVTGDGWGDLDDAVALIGDNRRKGDDAASIIDDLAGQAAKYQEITDDEMAKRAISLRAALQEQGKKIDKAREAEKAPHLRAAKAVDEVYMSTVKLAKTWADYLRHLVEAFETRKRRLAREAELPRQDICVDCDGNGRYPSGALCKSCNGTGRVFPGDGIPVPEPIDQIRTGYGRAASVRERIVVGAITDIHALVDHLSVTHWGAMHNALAGLAQKDVDQGIKVPGVEISEQAVIR